MDKANQLHSDVKRIVAKNSENLSFRKFLQLLVLIREWKGLLSSSDYVQVMRHRQRIMVLVDELLQLQSTMPAELASILYRLVELELENIYEFESYWSTLIEHQISLFISKLKSIKHEITMSKEKIIYKNLEWNEVTLVHYLIVGFDYETQQYKVRNKKDKTLEHWIDSEIIDAIDYFAKDAAYYNTNDLMARKAESKRLFMALNNRDEQKSDEGKSTGRSSPKVKPKFKPKAF